ncbi:MAG: hypothetical protein HY868_11125 [Chloroflexi bacterium]|nr:hypothetical protein [Chloroflexota bacterium]
MELLVANSVDATQIAVVQKMLTLQNQIKGGIGWFFWIAGLSLINSATFFAGVSLTFVIGLGATQIIDVFSSALAREFSPGIGTAIRVVGFGLDLFIAGIFAICGVLGRKRFKGIVVIGMVLYALDAVIFLAVGEWLGVVFHAWALSGLWRGIKAINELGQLEKNFSTGDVASLQKLIAAQTQTNSPAARKNLLRFALIIIIPIAFLLGFLILMLALYQK